jgi:hypothetical protein
MWFHPVLWFMCKCYSYSYLVDRQFFIAHDFFAERSGVSRHVSGDLAGGHWVCLVGYDDSSQCWIAKNSWGERGFFRIGYGECGIESEMWDSEGRVETRWLNNVLVQGAWAIDQDRTARVYLSTAGWTKIATDSDDICYNLLSQLLAAKAAGWLVNLSVDQGGITQIKMPESQPSMPPVVATSFESRTKRKTMHEKHTFILFSDAQRHCAWDIRSQNWSFASV